MTKILLSTLNAKYIHASLGLRYLYANMEELTDCSQIIEYTINTQTLDIAEDLLSHQPTIIGFGVYIWNIEQTYQLVAQLKAINPNLVIILGGPEVSYETETHPIYSLCDYVICGAADLSFGALCRDILANKPPQQKRLTAKPVELSQLKLPYTFYDDEDLKNRLLYVEASRGCPFKCEFCLSALDKTSYPFELERFLNEMDELFQRGARHFKFVDRTFNLKIPTTLAILDFFLKRLDDDLFLHFEVIPDHLPEALKEKLVLFPAGSLQFEVGIQSFNPVVQKLISRRQNNQRSIENLKWLRQNTQAHLHTDLIFGLPGENLASFEDSFNQLYACDPHEIQVGILKRLKGSPIIRHTEEYELVFNPNPPYNILSNKLVSFSEIQRINRFARYWDIVANSGRFKTTLPTILGKNPFQRFLSFSDWLFAKTQQTHKINLKKLFGYLLELDQVFSEINKEELEYALEQDYEKTKLKGRFQPIDNQTTTKTTRLAARQQRHLA